MVKLTNLIRYVITALATAFSTVLLEPFLSALLGTFGITTTPWAEPFAAIVQDVLTTEWVKALGWSMIGAFAAIVLLRLAARFDRSRALDMRAAGVKLSEMEQRLAELETEIRRGDTLPPWDAIERWVNKCLSLELTLNKLGLETPQISFDADPIGFIERMRRYASRIGPLIEDGHRWHAIAEAKQVSAEIRREAPEIGSTAELLINKPA
ncbi:hypothetical protein IP76_00455 [Rhizobium sp. AAP43]|nr:hypothetical protein IP76_00455 [Rhizobium sp. AAP43]